MISAICTDTLLPQLEIGSLYTIHNQLAHVVGLKPLHTEHHIFAKNGEIVTLVNIVKVNKNDSMMPESYESYKFYFIYYDSIFTTVWCHLDDHFCFEKLSED